MAKIRIDKKSFRRVQRNIQKQFKAFTEDKTELDRAGQIIVTQIKAETREGVGFDGESFPTLAGSTIERRQALATVNNTSRFFRAGRSNATFLGDTVNKITHKLSGRAIVLLGKGKHRKVKGIRVRFLEGSDAPTQDILNNLASLGYNILGVSERAKERIIVRFRRFIRRNISR